MGLKDNEIESDSDAATNIISVTSKDNQFTESSYKYDQVDNLKSNSSGCSDSDSSSDSDTDVERDFGISNKTDIMASFKDLASHCIDSVTSKIDSIKATSDSSSDSDSDKSEKVDCNNLTIKNKET